MTAAATGRKGGLRVALVTGAARGIGHATATALARDGFVVAATHHGAPTAVPPDVGEATGVHWYATDLADPDARRELVATVQEAHGPVDVFVANAALLRDGLTARMSDDDFTDVLAVNLVAPQRLAAALLPSMRSAGWGRIVFVSSVGGLLGSAGQANYASSKAALSGLAASLAVEAAGDGVTVNVVAPGPVDTELLRALGPDRLEALEAMVPAGRLGRPEEVASVIAFLCGDAAGFVNGVTLPVDGGLLQADTWSRTPRRRRGVQ